MMDFTKYYWYQILFSMHSLVQVVCVLIYLRRMRVWIEVSEDVLQLPIVLNTWNFLLLTSFLHGQDEYFEKYFIASHP